MKIKCKRCKLELKQYSGYELPNGSQIHIKCGIVGERLRSLDDYPDDEIFVSAAGKRLLSEP
jgi:hypothetical protein